MKTHPTFDTKRREKNTRSFSVYFYDCVLLSAVLCRTKQNSWRNFVRIPPRSANSSRVDKSRSERTQQNCSSADVAIKGKFFQNRWSLWKFNIHSITLACSDVCPQGSELQANYCLITWLWRKIGVRKSDVSSCKHSKFEERIISILAQGAPAHPVFLWVKKFTKFKHAKTHLNYFHIRTWLPPNSNANSPVTT